MGRATKLRTSKKYDKELDKLLAKQNRKILIVIDDIDRLSSAENSSNLPTVKNAWRFPEHCLSARIRQGCGC